MNANLYVIEDYENETAFRPQKNKPNQSQFPKVQNELKIACQKIWPHPFFHLLKQNLLTQEQNPVKYIGFYKNSGWLPRFANGFFLIFLLLIYVS